MHARVVLAERPTSAKPGDEALVLADGTIEGFVGGQCAQATVRSQGLAALESGATVLLRISPEPEPEQSGKTVVHNPCLSGGTLEIFMEPVLPAPMVRVIGDSPIAQALAAVGASLGYQVEPWSLARDAHHRRRRRRLARVRRGEGARRRPRRGHPLRRPGRQPQARPGGARRPSTSPTRSRSACTRRPGSNIGARTPEEVALSIFAEIIQERDAPLRFRSLPLLVDEPRRAAPRRSTRSAR